MLGAIFVGIIAVAGVALLVGLGAWAILSDYTSTH